MKISSNLNLPLPETPTGDMPPELFSALVPVFQAIHGLKAHLTNNLGGAVPSESALSNLTVKQQNLTTLYVLATQALPFGSLVSFTSLDNKLAVRPATAGTANPGEAQACILTGLPVLPGEICKVTLGGLVQIQVETPYAYGQFLYLSNSPSGEFSALTPTGVVKQRVGFTLDAYETEGQIWQNVWFNPNYGVNVI